MEVHYLLTPIGTVVCPHLEPAVHDTFRARNVVAKQQTIRQVVPVVGRRPWSAGICVLGITRT
jgi:hypothetical protein